MNVFKNQLKKLITIEKKKPLVNPFGRPKKKLNLNYIKQLHEQNTSNQIIASMFGVSEGTIRNRLKEIYKNDIEKKINFLQFQISFPNTFLCNKK